jgi:alkylhydroperoxidase/carboxymuconolactone decarboxylase family protein YurZ
VAVYAGVPAANSAIALAKEILGPDAVTQPQNPTKEEQQ